MKLFQKFVKFNFLFLMNHKNHNQFKSLLKNPIPIIEDISGREEININECGEELVALSSIMPQRIRVYPGYYLKGFHNAVIECYARKSLADRLLQATEFLPLKYKFIIFDAWRSLSLQKEIYEKERNKIRNKNSKLNEKKIHLKTQIFVSEPSNDLKKPPPHLTGGAIDLSLADKNNQLLKMGTSFDYFGRKASTRYYEKKREQNKKLSDVEYIYLTNRRLLYHILSNVGFTNYLNEWWHFDYGNQFWAKINRTEAFYGAINK